MGINVKHGTWAGLAGAVVLGLALAGCSPSAPEGEETGGTSEVTLRLAWWGNDTRNELTRQAVEKFEASHPGIKVELESTDWNGYWQKLSTQAAGGDGPDVFQMDEKYLAEYASQGALLDLGEQGLDTSDWAAGTVDAGRFDNKLYAATFGVNSPVFLANPSLFEAAGVALPDDSTWTWDDYAKLGAELQQKSGGAFYGAQNMIGSDDLVKIWVRQQGLQQFTDEGIGFDASAVTPAMEYWKKAQDDGATPPATVTIEQQTTAIDQSLGGTNKLALFFQWSNQVNTMQQSSGEDLVLLRSPSMTGTSRDAGLWYKSSMFLSASARTRHPAEAVTLIDYLINDSEAVSVLGTERGVPTNLTARAAISESLDEVNKKVIDFMDRVADDVTPGGSAPLPGGGQSENILRRATDQVLVGGLEPAAAAEQYVSELKAEMGLG